MHIKHYIDLLMIGRLTTLIRNFFGEMRLWSIQFSKRYAINSFYHLHNVRYLINRYDLYFTEQNWDICLRTAWFLVRLLYSQFLLLHRKTLYLTCTDWQNTIISSWRFNTTGTETGCNDDGEQKEWFWIISSVGRNWEC